jgi:hypothetical protein
MKRFRIRRRIMLEEWFQRDSGTSFQIVEYLSFIRARMLMWGTQLKTISWALLISKDRARHLDI